jgi:hypothetical protein
MTSIGRALGYGVLVWLVPFVVAFALFPIRESNRPLFESIMPLAVAAAAAGLAVAALRRARRPVLREATATGVLWLLICILIDAPLMLLGGPMRMTLTQYLADIGVTYLLIPIITVGIGAGISTAGRPETSGVSA